MDNPSLTLGRRRLGERFRRRIRRRERPRLRFPLDFKRPERHQRKHKQRIPECDAKRQRDKHQRRNQRPFNAALQLLRRHGPDRKQRILIGRDRRKLKTDGEHESDLRIIEPDRTDRKRQQTGDGKPRRTRTERKLRRQRGIIERNP